jgi:predicted TIM-barrel fold metal-dependent hydrolase
MEPIIDIHAHLGDICFPGGGALIGKTDVKKRHWFDLVSLSEWLLHRPTDSTDESYFGTRLHRQEIKSSLKRNSTASLENFQDSMRQSGISHSVALPIVPNVSFSDLQPVAEKHPAIIPFTGVDFTREYDVEAALRSDVEAGAKGMKLHPILQRENLTSKGSHEAVEAFAPHALPILIHTGICHYYLDETDKLHRETPEYGNVQDAIKLARSFPKVNFIFGHAGFLQWQELRQVMGTLKNVWLDSTFKSPNGVKDLIQTAGAEKVLFGSDWPWGNRTPALKILSKACKDDFSLERRILFENAAQLLNLSF